MKLHHIALGATDVARVAAFYKDLFSLPEIERFDHEDGRLRSIWLDMDGVVLMVEQTAEGRRKVEGIGAGPFLLAFEVASSEYDAFRRALADRLIDIEDQTDFTTYFRDPEGNRVAISRYPTEHASSGATSD